MLIDSKAAPFGSNVFVLVDLLFLFLLSLLLLVASAVRRFLSRLALLVRVEVAPSAWLLNSAGHWLWNKFNGHRWDWPIERYVASVMLSSFWRGLSVEQRCSFVLLSLAAFHVLALAYILMSPGWDFPRMSLNASRVMVEEDASREKEEL